MANVRNPKTVFFILSSLNVQNEPIVSKELVVNIVL
jgi:hypothetical protein